MVILWLFICPLSAQIQFEKKDKQILDDIFEELNDEQNKSTAELVLAVGKHLMGTPYVAHTLEGETEQLVINLRGLDCTTYAENCLAIARCLKQGKTGFSDLWEELTAIRYRNGRIDNYLSRLHYFSDWIYENERNKHVKNVSREIAGIPYPLGLDFMSTHPESYEQLKANPQFVKELAILERNLSSREMFYIPKNKLSDFGGKLEEGDIVGITTSIQGLDFVHVGIIVIQNGKIHLMHASSDAGKVIISENTLSEYLLGRKSANGIMVARPL